jgi:hypothetical protein
MAAREYIPAGEILESSKLRSVSVPRSAMVDNAVTPRALPDAEGMLLSDGIAAGGQISLDSLRQSPDYSSLDDSFFVVRRDWILMRSSALRRGDNIEIISADGSMNFGVHKLAFVKDEDDREVEELSDSNRIFAADRARDRVRGSARIDHVEITCDLDAYMRIKTYAEEHVEPSLMLIRREGGGTAVKE